MSININYQNRAKKKSDKVSKNKTFCFVGLRTDVSEILSLTMKTKVAP